MIPVFLRFIFFFPLYHSVPDAGIVLQVPAVVLQFLPGQEAGSALASILFGDVNPSGKLPLVFPNSETETWLQSAQQYPGVNNVVVYVNMFFLLSPTPVLPVDLFLFFL